MTVPFANHLSFHPSRDTEKVGEPRLRRGLLHGRIYLRTFARMREEGGGREGARKQVRGKSRQRVQEETAAVTGSEVGSVNSKSQT